MGQILAEWPFWKAQKAKLKGNETPKDQNATQKAKKKGNAKILKGQKHFWARSWPGGLFGKLKMQMANCGKGKTAKFKGEKAILGQILAEWFFCKVHNANGKFWKRKNCKI